MTKMTKNQLKGSIEKITQAIQLVSTTEGYFYDKAHATTDLMLEQKRRMEKELHNLEYSERRQARDMNKLETQYSELEAKLDAREGNLTYKQIDELRDQMYEVYGQIRKLRGE